MATNPRAWFTAASARGCAVYAAAVGAGIVAAGYAVTKVTAWVIGYGRKRG